MSGEGLVKVLIRSSMIVHPQPPGLYNVDKSPSLANVKELTETTITRGGIVQKSVLPKFKLISTHTARRSFATNIYLAGVPTISIMKITGHKTERSFMSYIRISQEENADKLINHPFFN